MSRGPSAIAELLLLSVCIRVGVCFVVMATVAAGTRYINNFNGKLSSIDERLIKLNIIDNLQFFGRVMMHNMRVRFLRHGVVQCQ